MALQIEFQRQGNTLFRFRSYLPMVLLPVIALAFPSSEILERLGLPWLDQVWEGFCILVSVLGLLVRYYVAGHVPAGTSGRNSKEQVAETLNTTGLYSVVRHPLYLGNFLIALGFILFLQIWWLVLIYVLAFWIYYERIMFAEESFLREKFGAVFLEWADRTPAFIPCWSHWRPSELPLDVRSIVRKEFTATAQVAGIFALLEIIGDGFLANNWREVHYWIFVLGAAVVFYTVLALLKRHTQVLQTEGR